MASSKKSASKKPKKARKASEPGVPSRLELRRDARKQAILRAAGAELARAGFSRASLDDIAEHVHVTKATLYHYFENKESLYQAWMGSVSEQVVERFEAAVDPTDTALDRLWKLAYTEVFLLTTEFPDYARLFMAGLDWPDVFQEQIRELRRKHENQFRSVIDEGIAAGELEVVDETAARYCLQGALAYVPEWYRSEGRLPAEEFAKAIADTVIRMFRKSGD
jgi:AcrR family transcriptional regulator